MPTRVDESTVYFDGPWTHRSVSANGSRFHIVEAGEGPLVLLLHGFPEFWWSWRHQLPLLANAGFRAVAMDLRGYGASDKPPRGYDAFTLIGDVTGMIRALGESNATLVGHDVGAFLAWSTAALRPGLVRKLVVIGSAHPLQLRHSLATDRAQLLAARQIFAFQLPRYEHQLTRAHGHYIEQLFHRWAGTRWRESTDFAHYVETCRQAMQITQVAFCALEYYRWAVRSLTRRSGWRFAALMRQPVTVPTLAIHGSDDRFILPHTARASGFFVTAPFQHREIPGSGHFPQNENSEETSRYLINWIR